MRLREESALGLELNSAIADEWLAMIETAIKNHKRYPIRKCVARTPRFNTPEVCAPRALRQSNS